MRKLLKVLIWCMSFILQKYTFYIVMFVVLVFVQQFCILLVPQYIQYFVDNISILNNKDLLRIGIETVFFLIVAILSRLMYMLCKMVFCERGTCDIQYCVVDKARQLGFDYFEKTPRGKRLAETYENVLSIYFIYDNCFPAIVSALFLFLISIYKVFVNIPIALALFLSTNYILLFIFVILSGKKIYLVGKEETIRKNNFYQQTYDWVESREEVMTNQVYGWMNNKNSMALGNLLSIRRKLLVNKQKVAVILSLFQIFVCAQYFAWAFFFGTGNGIKIGKIIAIYMYLLISIEALVNLANLFVDLFGYLASAEKPYDFFRLQPLVRESENPIDKRIDGNIIFSNVSFSYGNNSILSHISFKISQGEHVAVVGESGSGKTTLFKLLMRYYDLQSGKILYEGNSIGNYSLYSLRQYIGIVFQETFLFSTSVWDNLQFASPDITDEKVMEAIRLVELQHIFPNKDALQNTYLSDKGDNLSEGERQRLALARIYLKNPNIVLLDEVTSALDYKTEDVILYNLFTFFQDKTMLMISHRLSVIKQFPRIIVISEGRVVQDGSYDEISKEGTVFSELTKKGFIKNA